MYHSWSLSLLLPSLHGPVSSCSGRFITSSLDSLAEPPPPPITASTQPASPSETVNLTTTAAGEKRHCGLGALRKAEVTSRRQLFMYWSSIRIDCERVIVPAGRARSYHILGYGRCALGLHIEHSTGYPQRQDLWPLVDVPPNREIFCEWSVGLKKIST